MDASINAIAESICKIIKEQQGTVVGTDNQVPVGISNRHIHLSHEHVEILFGAGYQLQPMKELSQPGQYACKECLTIVGPSLRPIEKVRVLGPERKASQVEISKTDSYILKVKPPVRESGNIAGSAPITIIGPKGIVTLKEGCIIANRHIHMSEQEGKNFGIADGDYVTVDANGTRRTRFYDVQVRVHKDFRLEMHLDTDDANAAGLASGATVTIVK
ncbi:MAG: phosphate propanoyltransferase [Clostridia bacterium]|nr:phosphate propanoyltransferase [Clostridia bacterium]